MNPVERIAEIKTQLIGNRGTRALIVEGQDDLNALSQFLGKRFYPEVIHLAIDKLLGSKSAKERRQAIFRTLPVPADLDSLWLKMGVLP